MCKETSITTQNKTSTDAATRLSRCQHWTLHNDSRGQQAAPCLGNVSLAVGQQINISPALLSNSPAALSPSTAHSHSSSSFTTTTSHAAAVPPHAGSHSRRQVSSMACRRGADVFCVHRRLPGCSCSSSSCSTSSSWGRRLHGVPRGPRPLHQHAGICWGRL